MNDRDRPIARIVPIRTEAQVAVRRARKPFAQIRGRTYPIGAWSRPSLEVLLEERQGR